MTMPGSVAPVSELEKDAAALMDAAPIPSDMRDKMGNAFDGSIHAVGEDGKPRTNKDGTFARKRGRRPGTASGPATPASVGLELPPSQETSVIAEQLVDSTTVALALLFGPQWLLVDADQMKSIQQTPEQQREALIRAVAAYLKARPELVNLPPEAILGVALLGYALPRTIHPETRGRFRKMADWVKRKIGGRRFARAYSRADGERENDASKKVDG